MAVSVAIEFALPAQPGITLVRFYECATRDGTFLLVQETDEVGSYPNYINNFTITNATSEDDWFAITWVDSAGAESELSLPWLGRTQSVVSQVTQRVMQRGTSSSESVVIQESESVIEKYFSKNPYDVAAPVDYNVLSGLTYLVLARLIILDLAAGSSDSYTAGLVSQKSTTTSADKTKFLNYLLKAAMGDLGISSMMVLELADIDPIGIGSRSSINFDQTRLALTVNIE